MADINVTNEIIDVNVTEEVITVAVDSGAYPLPYPVYSVFGRTGTVTATEGDYSLTQLSDVTLTSPANGQVLKYNGTAWVNGTDNNTVTSVFGRTGAVVATSGDYTTTQVTEGTNLYFTDTRARAAISLTTTGTSGAATYVSGVINIPQYQGVLTNPVTGTGTTNTLPKFTGASAIGDSNITDSGSLITLSSNTFVNGGLGIGTVGLSLYGIRNAKDLTGGSIGYGIYQSGSVLSDVTTSGIYNRTIASTEAASFTLTNIFHFAASQGTFGAGSTVTNQSGFRVDATLVGATNNNAFQGLIPSGTGRFNLYMDGTADNFLAGNTGIGVSQNLVSSGPILTSTLTNGGTGYVDGTYTDVAVTAISAGGLYALYTIVVSGGIVTTATLTWGGSVYKVGNTISVSNTLLGGTGSGLIITIDTVNFSQLTIASATGGDITLFRSDGALALGENLGTIKWANNDATAKSSGIAAEIGAFAAGTLGGAYLSFSTRSLNAGTSLVEAMRIDSRGGVGIGATAINTYSLRVSKDITGATTAYGIRSDGAIQSDVTTSGYYFRTAATSAAASFTVAGLYHYSAATSGFGAGSTISNQYGFQVDSSMTGATNNYGFLGALGAATNTWNLYMVGNANNYMAGSLGIGTTTIGANLHIKTALSTDSSEEIALRVESTPTGGTADRSIELVVKNDGTAANTYGLIRLGNQATNANTPSTVVLSSGGDSFFRGGRLGIGTAAPSAGPITSITLTNGGSGYVDGTYTNVSFTQVGEQLYGQATYVVSGGIVTSATLVWGGSNYTVGQTLTTANTNLGGTGSGLVVTVATVDSSVFRIQSTLSSDISLFRYLISASAGASYGSIKWESNDSSTGTSGLQAQIGAYAVGTAAGGYLSFFTRAAGAYVSLVEAMRIDSRGGVGIGATVLTNQSLRVSKNITGSSSCAGITNDGVVQSDVTTQAAYIQSIVSTAAASFTIASLRHFRAQQGTIGAGSAVTNQYGYEVDSSLIGATNNYGFFGNIPSGTNRWNLYMAGTAANYMAGVLGIGNASPNASAKVQIDSTTQGFLPPRVTTTQKNAIATPAAGLMVFDTTLVKLCVYNGTAWETITSI